MGGMNPSKRYGITRLSYLRVIVKTSHICLTRLGSLAFFAGFSTRAIYLGYGLREPETGVSETGQPARDLAALCDHRLGPEASGAVTGSNQRTRKHTEEADLFGLGLDVEELLGAYPPIHRQVPRRGPQVLRDRDDVGAGVVQVVQRLADLGPILAHAQDEIGLGDESVGRVPV